MKLEVAFVAFNDGGENDISILNGNDSSVKTIQVSLDHSDFVALGNVRAIASEESFLDELITCDVVYDVLVSGSVHVSCKVLHFFNGRSHILSFNGFDWELFVQEAISEILLLIIDEIDLLTSNRHWFGFHHFAAKRALVEDLLWRPYLERLLSTSGAKAFVVVLGKI